MGDNKILESLKTNALLPSYLNIVIVNAGYAQKDPFENWNSETMDQMQDIININSIGPARVAKATFDKMRAAVGENGNTFAKFVIITSRAGSIGDLGNKWPIFAYRMSKAAVNMLGAALALEWKELGISVGLLHPGFVKTDMTNNSPGAIEPEESVKHMKDRIQGMDMDNSGTFWHFKGEVLPW